MEPPCVQPDKPNDLNVVVVSPGDVLLKPVDLLEHNTAGVLVVLKVSFHLLGGVHELVQPLPRST